MEFYLPITLPVALGMAFAIYWFCRRRGLPEHTALLIGVVAMVPAWSLAIVVTGLLIR